MKYKRVSYENIPIPMDDDFEEMHVGAYTQWTCKGNGAYMAQGPTKKKVPAGVYNILMDNSSGRYFCQKIHLELDEVLRIPDKVYEEIVDNVISFYDKKEHFEKLGYNHKRGILLYGNPGNGKSFILNYLIKELLKNDVIIFYFPEYVSSFERFINDFQQVDPNRKKLVIMEDIDAVMEIHENKSSLLNMLDGVKQFSNICFVATTNHPEKLEERIVNRPSRFDKRYLIDEPTSEVRKFYFERKLPKQYHKDIDKWVKDTEGLSFSHLRELIISILLFDWDYQKAINNLKGMKEIPKNKTKNKIGFSND